jgi:hypothetical protein
MTTCRRCGRLVDAAEATPTRCELIQNRMSSRRCSVKSAGVTLPSRATCLKRQTEINACIGPAMTPDTPALVARLRSIVDRSGGMFTDSFAEDLRERFASVPISVQDAWLDSVRFAGTTGLDLLAIQDAAAALDSLTARLAQMEAERDHLQYANEKIVALNKGTIDSLRAKLAASDAAVRAARAETWAEASKMSRGWLADEMLDRATAAREGQ